MIGPVFFALITTSLAHGFRRSALLAFGVVVSDLIYVFGSYLGVHFLKKIPALEDYLGFVGGVILIGFGIHFMVKKVIPITTENLVAKPKKRTLFFQGIGINGINPFVMLFWLSIASMVSIKSSWGTSERVFFYGSLLLTIFGIDILKAFLASSFRSILSPNLRKAIQIFAGFLICYFGVKMIWGTISAVL
ncbi:MAG: LysE family translocator [Algoriphagus sp.]|nr:LysE family translocator [Algoriphagus sp.]